MADMPLIQAAKITGVPYANLKKYAQRGQLRTRTIDGRVMVDEDDLSAYMATKEFVELHPRVVGQPMAVVAREAGNMIARLPEKIRGAILDGIPTSKKAGGPGPFNKALEDMPGVRGHGPASVSDDPHFEFEVGYQHKENPKWKHVSAQQWKLGTATWTFSADPKDPKRGTWIGGGSREGARLAQGFSPANPFSDLRPLGGSESADR